MALRPFYPPVSFYFRLRFKGQIPKSTDITAVRDNAFQEASGLEVKWDTEDIREGGQNAYAHRLPKSVQYQNLVLKRGFVVSDSTLATWCATTLASDFSTPLVLRDVQLDLLNEESTPLATWLFRDAWPVKWSMSGFKSQVSELAIETLEFAYANFQRV